MRKNKGGSASKRRSRSLPQVPVVPDDETVLGDVNWCARILGVSRDRVYFLVRNGLIPAGVCIRLGGQLRFNKKSMKDFLNSGGAGLDRKSPTPILTQPPRKGAGIHRTARVN